MMGTQEVVWRQEDQKLKTSLDHTKLLLKIKGKESKR